MPRVREACASHRPEDTLSQDARQPRRGEAGGVHQDQHQEKGEMAEDGQHGGRGEGGREGGGGERAGGGGEGAAGG